MTGLDQTGSEVQWTASGWAARIAQHEFDHLSGKMFLDKAPVETLAFDYWNIVNSRLGDFKLGYGGIQVKSDRNVLPVSNLYFVGWSKKMVH